MKQEELTGRQLERLDYLHNRIQAMLIEICPNETKTVEWDMELIATIADVVEEFFVRKKYCTDQEFNPYIEI